MLSEVFTGRDRVLWEGKFWAAPNSASSATAPCVGSGRAALPLTGSRSAWPSRRHTFSLFVTAVDDGLYLDKRYADRLGKVKVGSANVTFKRLADVDQDALREMATRARELLDSPPT